MKYNFICEGGKHNNYFSDLNNPPIECHGCYEKYDLSKVIEIEDENTKEIVGLTIIYQITQQRLEISTFHKTILGRENFGASIFSNILFNGRPVISKKHCSIEFIDGKYYLLDEGSTNGTFYSVNKISCANIPQVIEDKSIFYIGEEAFLAQIKYQDQKQEEVSQPVIEKSNETKTIKQYRCRKCGRNFEEYSEECPYCEIYKTLGPIYE